ncbi:hypothetical protein VST7929_01264 [Vibrio stylophorae]|uniref:Uncharacterized protein n=1 Tax=Vibrio stylophorae TaxID=659351 RepID=A0ABM8ZSV6_9VIBR|nr:hypothetical protein VST7929_01264 [Vibrio stylophorae]
MSAKVKSTLKELLSLSFVVLVISAVIFSKSLFSI